MSLTGVRGKCAIPRSVWCAVCRCTAFAIAVNGKEATTDCGHVAQVLTRRERTASLEVPEPAAPVTPAPVAPPKNEDKREARKRRRLARLTRQKGAS